MCSNKIMKKLFLMIILLFLILIQAYVFYLHKYDPGGGKHQEQEQANIPNYLFDSTFASNTWIFNQHVAQYSTRTILTQNDEIIIDMLVFLNYEFEKQGMVKKKIKCLVSMPNNEVHVLGVRSMTYFTTMIWDEKHVKRRIWKVQCIMSPGRHQFKLDKLRVALTDHREYLRLNRSNLIQSKTHLLSFHTPSFHNTSQARKKAVGHCVHMVRNLTPQRLKRLTDWLHIQKAIGIDKVRFYFAQKSAHEANELKRQFGEFVEFVDYQLDFEFICKYAIELKRLKMIDRTTVDYLYENCRSFYSVFFNQSKEFMLRSHEKVCTNDCLLNFKYEYEFGTNYDFDEFIFPRHLPTNDLDSFKSSCCANESSNYNIYDYAVSLTQKHTDRQVALFQFPNVAFLTQPEAFDFVNSILNNSNRSVLNDINSADYLELILSEENRDNVEKMVKLQNTTIECLNRTILRGNRFDSIWNMPYAVLINHRKGKSIYNMNLTLTFNQHDADHRKFNSSKFKVSIDEGFTAHFRESFDEFLINQTLSFSHFLLDLEFYQFLAFLNKK